jgi:uncharacterized iron-regulated protein
MNTRCFGVALFLVSLFARAELPAWQAPQGHDNPRLGQVLHTASGEWLEAQELIDRLAGVSHLAVGEKHDNPDHHALQLWLLKQLHARRPQGALVMEMIGPEQQDRVRELQGGQLPADPQLTEQLSWSPGWDWGHYGALVRWGLGYPRKLLAANLSRDEMLAIYRQPRPLEAVYGEEAQATLARVMAEAHCHELPQERLPAMLAIQQARDQRMAQVLGQAPVPAMLLAGAFHVRKDLGMPLHWSPHKEPPVVLMLVEAGSDLPETFQADFIWITAATVASDYCADLQAAPGTNR